MAVVLAAVASTSMLVVVVVAVVYIVHWHVIPKSTSQETYYGSSRSDSRGGTATVAARSADVIK
jgi:hypothetical protein